MQSLTIQTTRWAALSQVEKTNLLRRPSKGKDPSFCAAVQEIIEQVKRNKDGAVRDYTKKFDGISLTDLQVNRKEFDEAYAQVTDEEVAALVKAKTQIAKFHQAQMPLNIEMETAPGILCKKIQRPIEAVGLYIPGGTAPLVSTVLMLGVPASIAGCTTKVICTPPNQGGKINPYILVAADLCGVDQVFKAGGAQGIAALAYGTESIPKTDKIFGPGNQWVTQAKILVAQDPQGATIDMPAGPSEVLVVVDQTSDAEFAAIDLLSQAEHGTDSQVILVSSSQEKTLEVIKELEKNLKQLSRRDVATRSLDNAKFINVEQSNDVIDVIEAYAPEHLILLSADAQDIAPKIRNAASVFVGPWSPESVGDYASGPNHVLPTGGFSRGTSGLGTEAFMKSTTYQQLTPRGLQSIGSAVETIASIEGLGAHRLAVSKRLERLKRGGL
jgi:histidinol dehydrogenase